MDFFVNCHVHQLLQQSFDTFSVQTISRICKEFYCCELFCFEEKIFLVLLSIKALPECVTLILYLWAPLNHSATQFDPC